MIERRDLARVIAQAMLRLCDLRYVAVESGVSNR